VGQKGILILGSTHPASLELIYASELSKLGIENKVLGVQNLFLDYYHKSLFEKLFYRTGLSRIIERIQKVIQSQICRFKPEIVIVFKGMEVQPKTITWIKAQGIKVVNYNPDSPFIFSGFGSGNRNVTDSISLFDTYFTYDRFILQQLKERKVNCELLPFGFDACGFEYFELNPQDEILKICFLGNADKYRLDFIQNLAKKRIPVDVYGENWSSFRVHPSITIHGPLYGRAFWSTLQKYAVQLNMLRPHNLNSHNMRSFDIPGSGGIMLAPRTPDHAMYYSENSEVFLFSEFKEAVDQYHRILSLNFEERNKIRYAARMRSMNEHTYSHRVKAILESLNWT